jgi:D-3-phosphoglycerate dehydrogenase
MSAPSQAVVRIACLGFVFDRHAQVVLRSLAPAGFELSFAGRDEDVTPQLLAPSDVLLVVARVTDAMMGQAPRLRFIQKWGTGYEKIDVDAAARRGIGVAITAGANADTIAEHAIMLMLAAMRRVVVADRAVREGRWIPDVLRPVAQRLCGKTVGIVGFGNIGKAVARQLRGFGVRTLYTRRRGRDPDEASLAASYRTLPQLLVESDVVTLHCPGGAANRGLIGRAGIASMKTGAVLVNVARGELVDEDALVDALRSGHVGAAGLDVFAQEPLPPASPLRHLDNVVLTPHSAGSLMDDVVPMGRHAFANIERFLRGEAIPPADVVVPVPAPPAR